MENLEHLVTSTDPDDFAIEDVCARIERLTAGMMTFWKNPTGWAPVTVAGILSNSMLDEQASLSGSLKRWIGATSSGDLVLAWVNLGALVEGQLKLLLSVHLSEYRKHASTARDADGKRLFESRPDKMMLAKLQQFCESQVWDPADSWDDYVGRVRKRRNAIHVFKPFDLGTFADWESEVREHLRFVRQVNSMLPYPDEMYEPREH